MTHHYTALTVYISSAPHLLRDFDKRINFINYEFSLSSQKMTVKKKKTNKRITYMFSCIFEGRLLIY